MYAIGQIVTARMVRAVIRKRGPNATQPITAISGTTTCRILSVAYDQPSRCRSGRRKNQWMTPGTVIPRIPSSRMTRPIGPSTFGRRTSASAPMHTRMLLWIVKYAKKWTSRSARFGGFVRGQHRCPADDQPELNEEAER